MGNVENMDLENMPRHIEYYDDRHEQLKNWQIIDKDTDEELEKVLAQV